MSKRSIIYIDGFNLYYGALKSTPYKWLNLQKYFELLRQDDQIQRIWYFTAEVSGNQLLRQRTYLEALETFPKIRTVLGLYKLKEVKCRVQSCHHRHRRTFRKPEEKRTDVNIALQMLDDAYQGACERMVLVSGDSDLAPAISLVKYRHPHIKVSVYVPAQNKKRAGARELRSAADKHATLPSALLPRTQLPQNLTNLRGDVISKPSSW
ncbi:NYN domain-containing protein [cf. Phormidesmis sp. LEGE 11477]|nr:NYN domain-containing protein [cf. Phormidesmis sp. LEGE 11477]